MNSQILSSHEPIVCLKKCFLGLVPSRLQGPLSMKIDSALICFMLWGFLYSYLWCITQSHLVVVNEFGNCNSAGPTAALSWGFLCSWTNNNINFTDPIIYISGHKTQGVENETEIQSKAPHRWKGCNCWSHEVQPFT